MEKKKMKKRKKKGRVFFPPLFRLLAPAWTYVSLLIAVMSTQLRNFGEAEALVMFHLLHPLMLGLIAIIASFAKTVQQRRA